MSFNESASRARRALSSRCAAVNSRAAAGAGRGPVALLLEPDSIAATGDSSDEPAVDNPDGSVSEHGHNATGGVTRPTTSTRTSNGEHTDSIDSLENRRLWYFPANARVDLRRHTHLPYNGTETRIHDASKKHPLIHTPGPFASAVLDVGLSAHFRRVEHDQDVFKWQ